MYNDFDIMLALFSSVASTHAVATLPQSVVYVILLDVSC